MKRLAALLGFLGACSGGSGEEAPPPGPPPTWYQDVGPVLAEKCGACHRDGGIGNFSMERYEDVQPWAAAILDSVEQGRMPPWAATDTRDCVPETWFEDDPRLTAAEKQMLADWVAADAPAGDTATLTLHDPDVLPAYDTEVRLQQPYEVDGTQDIYQCFRIEVPDKVSDVWLTDVEVVPDNLAVVHHVLVWNDPEDKSASKVGPDGSYRCSGEPDIWPTELLAGWTPGQGPIRNPEGTGSLVKAGATLVVNMHYHPVPGGPQLDQTAFRLKWTTVQPANHVFYYMIDEPFGAEFNNDFKIPADKSDAKETSTFNPTYLLPAGFEDLLPDLPVFAIMPHMHYRGTDMTVTVGPDVDGDRKFDGPERCLIDAENYRFDFQNYYVYDTPDVDQMPVIAKGDMVKVQCTYDNSWSNPYMQAALDAGGDTELVDVYWGEQTADEMCMAVIGVVTPPIDLLGLF